MIIGTIPIPEYEEKEKNNLIKDDIGFNKNRKNIIKNTNFNMNIMKEKTVDEFNKLSIKNLQLSDDPTDIKNFTVNESHNIFPEHKKPIQTNFGSNSFYTNLLYPIEKREKNINNIDGYESGTFITDKINYNQNEKNAENVEQSKENIIPNNEIEENINDFQNQQSFQELDNTGFESIPELKHSIPVSFDKLVVNLSDEPGKPKPINPLFFIINGERPLDKKKFINFRTNPSLFTTFNKRNKRNKKSQKTPKCISKMLKTEQDLNELINKNRERKLLHDSQKQTKFTGCFNKIGENKQKLIFDLKRTIFNDPVTCTEDKYKILKDLQRNELMNRALGRGIFSCNKFHDDERKALSIQKKKRFENYFENIKNKLVINLRTNSDMFEDKKKSYPDSQAIITHDYLKIMKDNFTTTNDNYVNYKNNLKPPKYLSEIERFKNEEMNKNFENLYKPKENDKLRRKKSLDTNMDRILKKADFQYTKPLYYLANNAKLTKSNSAAN